MQGRLSFESAVQTTYAATSTWSGTNWMLYDTITIEADQINEDLTDFPVYVDLSDLSASFWSTVSDGGGDIRVTTDDGSPTELPREVVFASTTLQTGELHFKASTISSSTDTVFRVYYNGSTTAAYADTDTYGTENVWTNNYIGVWHMQQDPTGMIYDSTSAGRDGTTGGSMTSTDLVDGLVGGALNFDGADDYINVGSFSETLTDLSVSAWVRPETYGEGSVGYVACVTNTSGFCIENRGTSNTDFTFGSPYTTTTGWWSTLSNSASLGHFQHLYITIADITNTASDPDFYINGVDIIESYNTTPVGTYVHPNGDLYIGNYSNQARSFDGDIDEVRIASTSRSEAWIVAESLNQRSTTDFYTVNMDPAKVWNASDWTLYDAITIDAANIDGTLTDFPVYVDLADLSSQFWSTTDGMYPGSDIRVTNNANTELPREIVFASSTAQTGELHFKADSVSSSVDTVFKIWYNGTTTRDYKTDATYGAENVWTNDYFAVWHMQDDPTGVIYDSTYRDQDGAGLGSMTSSDVVAGSVGQALNFDGLDDYLDVGLFGERLKDLSISSWVRPTSLINDQNRIFTIPSSIFNYIWGGTFNDLNLGTDFSSSGGSWSTPDGAITTGTFQYTYSAIADITNTSSNASFYLDGAASTPVDEDFAPSGNFLQPSIYTTTIGSWYGESEQFTGDIDELRVASTTRSTAWIAAEHLNQATTTDFYSVAAYTPTAVVWNASDWTLYDTVTVDSTNIDSPLTDFPVYVDLSDLSSRFWSTTPSNVSLVATDIRVTNSSNQELPRELVFASSTAQTGELHFKADSISSSMDTEFRIWYNGTTTGDYATSTFYGAQNVWTNGYVGVWHMNEDPTGMVIDSTAFNRSATTTGSMTSGDVVAGAIGNALNFDGNDEINTGLLSMTVSEVSTELWVRPTTLNDAWHNLAWAGGTFGSRILGWGTDLYSFANSYSGTYGDWFSPSDSATLDEFQHMYFGRDVTSTANDGVIYKNAIALTITEDSTPVGTFVQPNVNLYLGGGGGGNYFIGDLDEVRVATTTRSDAWISAAYLNQSTTTDFYTTEAFVPAPTWNATDWTLYDTITIDASKVSASLSDFPVYIDLSLLSPQFWTTTPSSALLVGTDIRVTNSSNQELPRELVSASVGTQAGELHFKADSISSLVDTEFRIWYNGTTTGDYATDATYGAENVWTNDYVGVWHLEQDPSGGTGVVLDSTINDLDGTGSTSMTTGDLVAGKLSGYAYDFDGNEAGSNASYVNFGSDPVLDNLGNATNGLSICTWYDQDSIPTNDALLVSKSQSYLGGNMLYVAYDRLGMETYNDDYEEANYSPGEWQYMCGTWDGTDGLSGINLYIDAVDTTPSNTSTSATVTDDASYDLTIGNLASGGYAIDGRMDELRISSTTRSTAWIETEYVNQYNPASFYTVAANVPPPSVWNDSNWVFYDTLTIDADQVDADLTDFPVFVNLSDLSSTFWTTTPSDSSLTGTDIRVTNSSNEELPRELVFASSATEQGELHFKADTISSSTDTIFKIWYNGNSAGDYLDTATYGAHNVWTSDYLGVWHMQEDPTGAVRDSTSFNRAGVSGGSMTSGDRIGGAVGNAISFDGTDDYINTGSFSETLSALSVSAWIRPDTFGGVWQEGVVASLAPDLYFDIDGSNYHDLNLGTDFDSNAGQWSTEYGSIVVGEKTFQHVYGQISDITNTASNASFYIDGVQESTVDEDQTPAGTFVQPDSSFYIGNYADLNYGFDGEIDELRVASTTRSSAWVAAEYANQNVAVDFYTVARSTDEQVRTEVFPDVMSGATWQVPPEVYSITVKAWGAGGGGGGGGDVAGGIGGNGGSGGFIEGTINVTPGETLLLYVGGGGGGGEHVFDDGGSSAGGGGYSGVFRNTTPLFVAGAGGGAGGGGEDVAGEDGGDGGPGGGWVGSNGVADGGANFGYGGTQSAGGGGGAATDNVAAEDGAYLSGGDGIETNNVGVAVEGAGGVNGGGAGASGSSGNRGVGGGGGAGYYGGGGGTGSASGGAGGGGGSSYAISSATATTTESGTTIYPPRATDASYVFGAGAGGIGLTATDTSMTAESGGTGLVVIQYEYKPAPVWNISDWKEYELITIDSANIDEELTDFPVYVNLAELSSDFWNGIATDSTDIRVTTDAFSPVELPREVVSASTSLMIGELHFKANTISSSTDTSFRIYYNGSAQVDYQPYDTYGAENVWTNDYVGVWHMDDDPSGLTFDSSANRNHGVAEGGMVLGDINSSSQIGEGLVFDGSDQMLNFGDIDALDTFGEATFSIWANRTTDNTASTNHNVDNVFFAQSATVGNDNFEFGTDGTFYDVYLDTYDVAVTGLFSSDVTNGTWFNTHYVYASTSASELKIYKDGSLGPQPSTWGGDLDPTTQASFTIGGARPEGDSWGEFIGTLDEARVALTARSAAWISAEHLNQSDTASFYATSSPVVGSTTLAVNDGGQVSNAFTGLDKTNEALFSFKLTPNSGNATVTDMVLVLTGTHKVKSSDFTNIRLYQDTNDNAAYDGGDTVLDATGVMRVTGQSGTITFDSDFALSTATNYVVVADWNAPKKNAFMTVTLPTSNLVVVGDTGAQFVNGSVTGVQHMLGNQGAGGGSSARLGGAAPVGDGVIGGGGQGGGGAFDSNTGGDTIGSETDFYWPSAQSGSWTGGTNAYDQADGTYATTNTNNTNDYISYSHGVPSTDTVEGIEVRLEVSGTTAAGNIGVELTWDGGGSFTSTGHNTGSLTTTDAVMTLGGPSDKWGHIWTAEQVNNTNFGIRVTGNPSSNTVQIDAIQVKIYHQASGGSGGGGGRF